MNHRLLSSLPLLACLLFLFSTAPQSNAQTTIPNIQDLAPDTWQWCNGCASNNSNTNATGGVAAVTQSGYQISGKSIRFDLIDNCGDPCTGYGNVFFYNVLTHDISECKVTIDMYAMMNSVGNANSQAVEFTVEHDICKSNCGLSNEEDFRYIFSLQCDFEGGVWNVWDGAAYSTGGNGWQSTGHACVNFQAMSFNHFIFDFTRQDQNVTYVDMWINGVQYTINKQYGIQYDTPNYNQQFLASMQLDGDSTQGAYSVWADEWNVTYQ